MKIRIPVFQQNSLNERILRSGLVSQLRATPFTSGLISGTEMTIANGYSQNNYGYYEFEILGADLTKLLKLYVSADNGVTFEQITTWGGTDGIRQKEYLVYSALMNQTGTSAPVATVLENTTGQTLTWVYNSVGDYSAAGTFGLTKTFVMANQGLIITSDGFGIGAYNDTGVNIVIKTNVVVENGGDSVNGALTNTALEVRIYP